MASEPSLIGHLHDWLEPASSTLLIGTLAWLYKLGKRVDAMEFKVDMNRNEYLMEIKHLQETLQRITLLLERGEEKWDTMHTVQIETTATLKNMIGTAQQNRSALDALAQTMKCPLQKEEVIPR